MCKSIYDTFDREREAEAVATFDNEGGNTGSFEDSVPARLRGQLDFAKTLLDRQDTSIELRPEVLEFAVAIERSLRDRETSDPEAVATAELRNYIADIAFVAEEATALYEMGAVLASVGIEDSEAAKAVSLGVTLAMVQAAASALKARAIVLGFSDTTTDDATATSAVAGE